MKKIKLIFTTLLLIPIFLIFFSISLNSQVLEKSGSNNSGNGNKVQVLTPGAGLMVAGDLWESFQPAQKGPTNTESANFATRGISLMVKVGNFDRLWQTPGGNYPIGFTHSLHWARYFMGIVYDNDPTFNPAKIGGADNNSYYTNSKAADGDYSNYAMTTWKETVKGSMYANETKWVDATKRHHMVWEAGWPTQVGIDYKVRAHSFSGPNWNNLNDFVILEVTVKNTGNVDMNMDGVYEKTNHKVQGLAFWLSDEYSPHASNDPHGQRGSEWCQTPSRDFGYINDPDPDGNPWAFAGQFVGTSTFPAKTGANDMGMIWARRWYIDTYQGYTFIACKKGSFPADQTKGTYNLPDKPNMWGTPTIGTGAQRGWYLSSGNGKGWGSGGLGGGGGSHYPRQYFNMATGTFVQDGGKANDNAKSDLSPNTKFFSGGTKEKYETFVPKTTSPTLAERPNGDRKLLSEEVGASACQYSSDLTGMKDATTPYATGWGKWSKGFIDYSNYDGDLILGCGPISLDVGEEATVVLLFGGGFRLEGLQRAMRAGRWAYEKDYVVPEPPPVPEMKISNSANATVNLEWDKRAETDAEFAGYKIWRSSQFKKYAWLENGMRLIDHYQEQMTVGEDKAKFRTPINPRFDAQAFVALGATKGMYPGYTYGTWELMKIIPKADIANLTKSTTSGYNYKWEDKDVVSGFTYWYYISAYKEGTYTGPGGETTTRLETHSLNRNGATGLWCGTYPFATSNSAFPVATDIAGLKAIGARQIVYSALASVSDLNKGVLKVGVKPNPYRKGGFT